MHIYTSSFFKFRNKANFYSFLGASAGTGAPRNTQKIGTQCGCEYGYKNYESFGSLIEIVNQNAAVCKIIQAMKKFELSISFLHSTPFFERWARKTSINHLEISKLISIIPSKLIHI